MIEKVKNVLKGYRSILVSTISHIFMILILKYPNTEHKAQKLTQKNKLTRK